MAKAKVKTDKTPVDLLTAKQAKAEHARLQVEISEHDRRYYQQDRPSISDAEYDALRRRYNGHRSALPRFAHAGIAVAESRRRAVARLQENSPRGADAVARQRLRGSGRRRFRRPHPPLPQAQRRRKNRLFAPSRRSTGCRCRCATRTANSSPPPPAATAKKARTSPPISARSRTCRKSSKAARAEDLRGARRGLYDQSRRSLNSTSGRKRRAADLRQSAQFGGRLACGRRTQPSPPRGRSASSPMPGAR